MHRLGRGKVFHHLTPKGFLSTYSHTANTRHVEVRAHFWPENAKLSWDSPKHSRKFPPTHTYLLALFTANNKHLNAHTYLQLYEKSQPFLLLHTPLNFRSQSINCITIMFSIFAKLLVVCVPCMGSRNIHAQEVTHTDTYIHSLSQRYLGIHIPTRFPISSYFTSIQLGALSRPLPSAYRSAVASIFCKG